MEPKQNRRHPTLFEEESDEKLLGRLIRQPLTETEVQEVEERIRKDTSLTEELERIGVDIQHLSCLIALNLQLKHHWRETHKHRDRAIDRARKTRKAIEAKESENCSEERRKLLTTTITRKILADEEAERARYKTKERPYLIRFIHDLTLILSGPSSDDLVDRLSLSYEINDVPPSRVYSPRPFRYIAAIFNLFNFHAENFQKKYCIPKACKYCKPEEFDKEKGQCVAKGILHCPHHTLVRDKLYQLMKEQTSKSTTDNHS